MDKSSFTSRTRNAHAFQRMMVNSLLHMAHTKVEHASRLAKHAAQSTTVPSNVLSRETLNAIWVFVTSMLCSCSARTRIILGYLVRLNTISKIRMDYKGSGESGRREAQIHWLYKENPCEHAGRRVFKMWMYRRTCRHQHQRALCLVE